MIFTEEDKAFVEIFVPYYRLSTTEIYERIPNFPGKRRNTFGLDNLISRSCLKGGCPSARMEYVAYRRLCVSLTSDAIGYSD